MSGVMCGGTSGEREPSDDEVELALKVKPDVENQLNRTFSTFKPTGVRTQVVAGINYFFKVMVGENDFIHLRVHRTLEQNVQLHGVQHGKKQEDELTYF
ncbi:Cystatin domain containing protein [Trichuris trichiura]|uniref:Cystatin domain containing protein n=1 Tax=Trichuris trichiura TaxID=36087 RepID=A0A077Z0W3_TRITR|nr:Cystatin domain containing protein [Trichuris trichiura]